MSISLQLRARAELERRRRTLPDSLYRYPYRFYGVNAEFHKCIAPTAALFGPSETGKTLVALALLHEIAVTNPGVRLVLARKIKETMYSTVLRSFEDKILPEDGACYYGGKRITVQPFGGERPQWYNYSNGSIIFVAGLDKSQKVLSGEFDGILVNQAEELSENDLEILETRVSGRAGNIKHRPPQLLLEGNPGGQKHPILLRSGSGKLTMFSSRHEDNPTLYDQATGALTEQGKRTMHRLDNLTGVRYARLRKGLWAGAEGLYFAEFDSALHGLDDFVYQPGWPVWASMDYGFNHPNVTYFHCEDGDGNVYTFHELWHRQHYPNEIAPEIHLALSEYGLTIRDLQVFLAGGDVFARTGHSDTTIAEDYLEHEIVFQNGETGPGSRIAKAHHLLGLLGNRERNIPPRWFYSKTKCKRLAECLPGLVPDEKNPEDVRKVNANPETGEGGDDEYDALVQGIYRPNLTVGVRM